MWLPAHALECKHRHAWFCEGLAKNVVHGGRVCRVEFCWVIGFFDFVDTVSFTFATVGMLIAVE